MLIGWNTTFQKMLRIAYIVLFRPDNTRDQEWEDSFVTDGFKNCKRKERKREVTQWCGGSQ
jgi:hypothetical protein